MVFCWLVRWTEAGIGIKRKRPLKRCLSEGRLKVTNHFRRELEHDRLRIAHAFQVCHSGAIFDEPELDVKYGGWKYRIEGMTTELARVAVVFTFDSDGKVVFITAWKKR
jgi:hypothetical protein